MKQTTCQDIETELALYAIGALDGSDVVKQHLTHCPGCRRALQEYQSIADWAGQDPAPDKRLTELLHQHVMAGLQKTPTRKWMMLAAGLVAGLGIALMLPRQENLPAPQIAKRIIETENPEQKVPSMLSYRFALNESMDAFEERLDRDANALLKPDDELIAQIQSRSHL